MYALSLSPSLSPGGIILRSLFPHDAGETKDYVHTKSSFSLSLSLCLCGTDRSLLCLRISCERVEYVAAALSQSQVFPSLIPPAAAAAAVTRRQSAGSSARRAIDYIFPAEIETSFRLSIIDSSPFSTRASRAGDRRRGHRPRSHLFLKLEMMIGRRAAILPPDIYTTRCGPCGRAGGQPLSVALCFFAAHLFTV